MFVYLSLCNPQPILSHGSKNVHTEVDEQIYLYLEIEFPKLNTNEQLVFSIFGTKI